MYIALNNYDEQWYTFDSEDKLLSWILKESRHFSDYQEWLAYVKVYKIEKEMKITIDINLNVY